MTKQSPQGLFETILWKDGRAEFLDEHLDRLQRSCAELGISFPKRDYTHDIGLLVKTRGLKQGCARVRIIVELGEVEIQAESYQPPSPDQYRNGVRLITMPHPRPDARARLKLRDRTCYDEAFAQAKAASADECLFIHEERILECATANVIVEREGRYFIPRRDDFRLSGVMEQAFLSTVRGKVVEGDIPWPLDSALRLLISNSLRGIIPASL